ncbi:MAG: hypothetical protein ACRDZR_11705 [Acidimicrobiales bacterium]
MVTTGTQTNDIETNNIDAIGKTIAEIDVDSRHRLPLAKVVEPRQTRFRIRLLPSGEYLLTPVVSISERELAMLRNAEATERLRHGIDEVAVGKVVHYEPGHFSALAGKLGVEDGDVQEA